MSDVNKDVEEIDESQQEEVEVKEDPVKNLKAEFNRKLDNVNTSMSAQLAAIMEKLNQSQVPTPTKPEPDAKSLKDLAFDDPERYAEIVAERATRKAQETVSKQTQSMQATQSVLNDYTSKYPEFSQDGSEATRIASQKAQQLPPHLKNTPEGARMVLAETVAELGLTPSSKRRPTNDDFAISGQSGSSTKKQNREQKSELTDKELAWAELLDPNALKDPKRQARLKEISKSRKDRWTKYE